MEAEKKQLNKEHGKLEQEVCNCVLHDHKQMSTILMLEHDRKIVRKSMHDLLESHVGIIVTA